MNFGGMYGPYWPAHMGGGYLKFLKRRSDLPGTYKHKSPLTNLWRRKLDERGIFCEFPRAQDYQVFEQSLFFFACFNCAVMVCFFSCFSKTFLCLMV